MYSDLMLCTTSGTSKILAYWKLYLGIFKDAQLLRHIQTYWGIVKAYSGLYRHIQCPLQPLHINKLAILRALSYLELEAYSKHWKFDQAYSEPCHRTGRTVYSGIIQPYSCIFRTLCNTFICRNLEYMSYNFC